MQKGLHGILKLLLVLACCGCFYTCAVKQPTESEDLQKEAFANFILPSTWQNSIDTLQINNNWLSTFNNPTLDSLVQEALIYNQDLRISSLRVTEANGYVESARAALRPALSILGNESTKLGGDLGSNGLNGGIFAASWELDIWGKLRSARSAEIANYEAIANENSFAQLSIAAMITKTYYLATETYLQINLAKEMIKLSQDMETISQNRFDVGIGTEIDIALSKATLNKFNDALFQLELAYNNQLRALELLLGRYPCADIETNTELPESNGHIPAGIPAQILERRPDILAAQNRFNAAFYRVGEANAARLPQLNLTASLGLLDTRQLIVLADNFSNPIRSIGGKLVAPIYQGGALKANVNIRNTQQQQAIEVYSQTVLNALADVESALNAVNTLDSREVNILESVKNNERAFELEKIRYKVGKTDMRDLIDQQMDFFKSQTDLLSIKGEKIVQRTNLFLALGGDM
ncbi:TolC family protein [Formosa haliotis]|uniref:TolC family protein n=1 Tax=Formosa haliotis TaxID=1555194 RepID=UPI00082708F1|nr:TolC family protein [Formosa haliotis]